MGLTSSRNDREQDQSSPPSSRGLIIGTTSGVLHGIVTLYLWHFFGFKSLQAMYSTDAVLLGYTLLGMFALGFVPGLLYAEWESVSPGLLTGGLLCLSSYGTWTTIGDGATPVDPTPFGWYTLLWVGTVVVVTGVGWAELRVTQ